MRDDLSFIKKYPIVAAVVVAGVTGIILQIFGQVTLAKWILSIFALAVALKLGWGMIETLKTGKYGIDILAFVAIVSTVVIGEYWAATVIVLMLTGGEALEDFAEHRATRELTELLKRAPQTAHLKKEDGTLKDVPISEVKKGDVLVVKPSEVIPVDGTLQDEHALLDESSLTGESLPVEKKMNDELMSGAINSENAITIKATQTAEKSQYQQIINLVKTASESEAKFVRLADRYAIPFTLIAFVIAGAAWAVSGEALRFAQVLVVATPCPLLLGAPIAFISGMSRSAKHGVIVKNGSILERLATIKTAAFDKTGTLTEGRPEIVSVHTENGFTEDEVLKIAASTEQSSTHILAKALILESKKRNIPLMLAKDVKEVIAHGITATLDDKKVLVGRASFLKEHGIEISMHSEKMGETIIHVAEDNKYTGSIILTDKIRKNAKETISKLYAMGVGHTLMVTGDEEQIAMRIAEEAGIEDVRAKLLPQDKVQAVKELKMRPVLMVGDGVNDAPVLAAAEVGMAMGARGSTAASEVADVVVLLDDISKVADALKIAKNTLKIALQSVWFGIALSVVLMIVAATGVIPAVIGAALQEVVDVVVIFNALRAHLA
jgi:heavy metal translocating P-type ATPase